MTAFLTLSGLVLLLFGLATARNNPYSLRTLFLLVWFAYGFSVGIDLLMGCEIRVLFNQIDLNDPSWNKEIHLAMLLYLACGFSFLVTYQLLGSQELEPIDQKFPFQIPPAWLLLGIGLAVIGIYVQQFLGMTRIERAAATSESLFLKGLVFSILLLTAFYMLIVLACDDKRAWLAVGMIIFLGLVTGTRNYILMGLFVGAFRWRPQVKPVRIAVLGSGALFTLMFYKFIYGYLLMLYNQEHVSLMAMFDQYYRFSLSGMDPLPSYTIIADVLQDDPQWYLGRTYWEKSLLLTWPRFLGSFEVYTLGEIYTMETRRLNHDDGQLAYASIAEAWLNFGYAGPFILGIVWAACARYFDSRPRGIAYFIFAIMTWRVFRSDFASMYKNWIIVLGFCFLVSYIAMKIYTMLVAPSQRNLGGVTSAGRMSREPQQRLNNRRTAQLNSTSAAT